MTQQRMSIVSLIEYLGIQPKFIGSSMTGGSSFEFHVAQAAAAIEAGLCNVAVIAYGSTQRSVGRKQASQREVNPYETPFKPFLPTSAYALAASRHMHQYGTTREHLAEVAVAARKWAQLNPVAWEKKPLTVEDVLKSRMISHPLSVRDCCLVTDGGGAIVMTSAERAKSLKKPPAYVLGCGHGITHMNISSMPDLTVTGAKQSGEAAYKMAKLSAKDIDMVRALRRLHHQHDPVPGGPGLLQEGRGRGVRVGRQHRAGRRAAGEHQWRRAVVLPSRHVRAVDPDRGRAAVARRMRRAAGEEARRRDGARQWRRAVGAGERDFGDGGDGVTVPSP